MNASTTTAFSEPRPMEKPNSMNQIAMAGFVGTAIEFFDLEIYSIAAALVFAPLFFPQLGELAGTVAAFGTIGVAFVFRPLGSILFGHIGDRIGRKRTLTLSLILMGLATVCTGLLPTGQTIGMAAPIILILLRVVQGLAAGGEFAGAALILSENAPTETRGTWSCVPNLGGAASLAAAGLTVAIVSFSVDSQTFQNWAWRVPFLVSFVLLVFGIYIRLKLEETPVFKNEVRRQDKQSIPLVSLFREQGREICLAWLVVVPAFTLLYLVVTFMANYGKTQLGLSYTIVPIVMMVSGVGMFIGIFSGASLSDRIGRRRVLLIANATAIIWVVVMFPMLYGGSMGGYLVACGVSIFISGFTYGPAAAFMSELFRTKYRYTAVGLSYNGAGILGGAVPPLLAEPIIHAFGHMVFGLMIALLFAVSFLSCLALRETWHTGLAE